MDLKSSTLSQEQSYDFSDKNKIYGGNAHVIHTVPQVGGYALSHMQIFRNLLKQAGYKVYCYTFGDKESILYDPIAAMTAYTEFYEAHPKAHPKNKIPPWRWLLNAFGPGGYLQWNAPGTAPVYWYNNIEFPEPK